MLVAPEGLTWPQTSIWLDQQFFPDKPIYNTGAAFTIRGQLRFDLFETALRKMIAESPGLLLPPSSRPPDFDFVRLDFRSRPDPLAEAEKWMRDDMARPFRFDGSPLFRFALVQIADDRTVWYQKFHHIIMDTVARRNVLARTASWYRALRLSTEPPDFDQAKPDEVVASEQSYAASVRYQVDRQYWLDQVRTWPDSLISAQVRQSERMRSGRPSRLSFMVEYSVFRNLTESAESLRSSAADALTALAYVAFSRLYDRPDILLCVELARRSTQREKNTIGLFASPVPVHLRREANSSISSLLQTIKDVRDKNYPHRKYPVHELSAAAGLARDRRYGLFDAIVNYLPVDFDLEFEGQLVEMKNISHGFPAPWLVTIEGSGAGRDVEIIIDFDPGLVSEELARSFRLCLEYLVKHGLDHPECAIDRLPIMPNGLRDEVLALGHGNKVEQSQGLTLASLFSDQAATAPSSTALICGSEYLSYRSVNARAETLARQLAGSAIGPGSIVGLALPRSPELIIAVLAVHKAGAAYLALDPTYPPDRLRLMVRDCGAHLVVTVRAHAPLFTETGAKIALLSNGQLDCNANAEPTGPAPTDLAYALYTSGSTGTPKAVGIEHRNVVNLVSWGRSYFTELELKGVLFSTSLNFDLSAFEMFVPLAFGGCVIMAENLLAVQSINERNRIRVLNTGPSLLRLLLETAEIPKGVTTIILAGEKLTGHIAKAVFGAAPSVRLLNCYGPTETTVYSTAAEILPTNECPSIGKAVWNTELYVVDKHGELLPPGSEGELLIGGAGVGRGYLNMPDMSAVRFLTNPFGSGRVYQTGDCVRWQPDGQLEFLGRADSQIKLHGIRIEPGEIESVLLGIPEVAAAAVVSSEEASGRQRLLAYLVASGTAKPSVATLRASLEICLPRYMMPNGFVWVDTLPLTPNGKLDRKALPVPSPDENAALAEPPQVQTPRQQEISAIIREMTGISTIPIGADFFELGGDSLTLLSLFVTLEERYGRAFKADVLTSAVTVERLARLVDAENTFEPDELLVAMQPFGDATPFFCAHGIGGDVIHLHRLAAHFPKDRPFIALRRKADRQAMASIRDIAADFVPGIIRYQRTGPIFLGGYSFGATVAYELACQLESQGRQIALLVLFDQLRPGWRPSLGSVLAHWSPILRRLPHRLLEEVGGLPPAEAVKKSAKHLTEWAKKSFGYRESAASIFSLNKDQVELAELYETHLNALRNYKPSLSSFPIAVFRAERESFKALMLDESLGWSAFSKGRLKTRRVPGSHRSMLAEPFVRKLAEILNQEITIAEAELNELYSSDAS
jgi:amino acid adenylation domain-containing protein